MVVDFPRLKTVHYLFTRSGNNDIGHCLDFDLAVSGKDRAEVEARLDILVKAHVEICLRTGNYSGLKRTAPDEFWNRFSAGKKIEPDKPFLKIEIPEIVPIQNVQSQLGVIAAQAV
jgi:hypothetical protein